jgi:phosphopantetheine adenylyltransferase
MDEVRRDDQRRERIERATERTEQVAAFLCLTREAHHMRRLLHNYRMEAIRQKQIDLVVKRLIDSVED